MGLLIGKKQCRTLYWRLKAAVRRAVKRKGGEMRFKFQYDPSSYALNFDDGGCNLGASEYAFRHCNLVGEGYFTSIPQGVASLAGLLQLLVLISLCL